MFTKYKALFICTCVCLLGTAAYSQLPGGSVGLKELLGRVGAHTAFLMSDSAAILIKQAQQHATSYNWLPSFNLNVQGNLGTNNNMPGGYFSYGIVPGNSKVRATGSDATLLTDLAIASLNWEVYDFGERRARQQVAASEVNVEQWRYEQRKYDLESLVLDTYLQWLQTEDLLAIQQQNIDRAAEIRRSILSLAKSGVKAGVDTSIAEAEISKLRLTYLDLQGQRNQFKLLLSAIANTPQEQLRADTAYAARLIAANTNRSLPDSNSGQHPLLQYYRSLYQSSLDKERLVKKSYYPSVSLQAAAWGRGSSLSATDQFRELSKGFGLERGNYLVGVGITYDLFDLKRKQLQLKTQEAVSSYAEKQLQEQQLLLGLTGSKMDARLATAAEKLKEIPHQLTAAQAAYRQKLSLYKNGLINIVELNMALSVLYRAEIDLITAKYMYCKALIEKAISSNQVQTLLQFTN
jgi:outer membrane protein TolC